jgi:peptidoglycan-associated lipoprotein
MWKFLSSFSLALMLAACGTSVPLSEVPVTDGAVKSVGSNAPIGSGSTGVVASNSVAQVEVGNPAAEVGAPAGPNIVYFDYDSFVIKPEFQSVISTQARFIKGKPARKVAIEGHTDETGGREYNLALGQRRAEAVASALIILGVPATQMEAVSFGKEKPAVVGNGEAAYSKNRRAEIRVQ